MKVIGLVQLRALLTTDICCLTRSNSRSLKMAFGLQVDRCPRQHSTGYMGDGFYRSKDPTNSIKVLKGHIQHINNRKIH